MTNSSARYRASKPAWMLLAMMNLLGDFAAIYLAARALSISAKNFFTKSSPINGANFGHNRFDAVLNAGQLGGGDLADLHTGAL